MKIEDVLSRNLDFLMKRHEELNSQQKLSKKSGVGQTSVGRMRRGEGSATVDNVQSVARVFGLSASELLDVHLVNSLSQDGPQAQRISAIVHKLRTTPLDERQLRVIEATLEIE